MQKIDIPLALSNIQVFFYTTSTQNYENATSKKTPRTKKAVNVYISGRQSFNFLYSNSNFVLT